MVLAERKLIQGIRRHAGHPGAGVACGIGDDAAVLEVKKNHQLLVTTDLCIEDVHFRRIWHPPHSVGYRCLARGLSDIAAMGGEPLACFLSLALPPNLPQKWVDEFLRGLLALARRFHVTLAGGDISSSEKITADIVVTGQVPSGKALLRSGAHPGDRIYVTGRLGGSAAVLQRLYAGERMKAARSSRHFYPLPRLEAGQWLRSHGATAMIDISDGLSVDLNHLCEETRVSTVIDERLLPVMKGATLDQALHGGDDYELLFTAGRKTKIPPQIGVVPVTAIGEVLSAASSGSRVFITNAGKKTRLRPSGWQHFSESC